MSWTRCAPRDSGIVWIKIVWKELTSCVCLGERENLMRFYYNRISASYSETLAPQCFQRMSKSNCSETYSFYEENKYCYPQHIYKTALGSRLPENTGDLDMFWIKVFWKIQFVKYYVCLQVLELRYTQLWNLFYVFLICI